MKEDGFYALMHDARVVWDFCGCIKHGEQLHVAQFVPSEGPVHAAQFVEWLVLADDVNPNLAIYERHKAALSVSFTNHMGGDVVEPKFAWPFSQMEKWGLTSRVAAGGDRSVRRGGAPVRYALPMRGSCRAG